MNDVRLIELKFLQFVANNMFMGNNGMFAMNSPNISDFQQFVDIPEMVASLLEDLYVACESDHGLQHLALRLRGEYHKNVAESYAIHDYEWNNPRENIVRRIQLRPCHIRITWRGLQRIEYLRSLLVADRILEHFGVLLDIRYYHDDLRLELGRGDRAHISVFALDLDKFKNINDTYGHPAGDVVMKAYLTAVRDTVGTKGRAYRGSGDEVKVILPGLNHDLAMALAEKVRLAVASCKTVYEGEPLPSVTTSIGVATCPPDERTPSIEDRADERQRKAKVDGRDQVVGINGFICKP